MTTKSISMKDAGDFPPMPIGEASLDGALS
jgi:hypothetical protein